MAKDVDAIIFDLGKVIIDVDFTRTIHAFEELGVRDVHQIMGSAYKEAVFDRFETGYLSENAFRHFIRNVSGLALTDRQIDRAWEAMLGEIPITRLQLISEIGQNFSTFLLSNTNPIHMKAIYNYVEQEHKHFVFRHLFVAEYYSYEIGKRKPEPEVFYHILDDNQLMPEKTIFIDDAPEHITSAQRLGLQTRQVDERNELASILNELKRRYAIP